MKPKAISLEATSSCQLRCPSCPTASGAIQPVLGIGYLRFDDFRALVDSNPRLSRIELSNYGEMFLNPDLLRILEHAHRRGVMLTANNGVNLNHADKSVLEGLVKFRFKSLTCSIDGASDETYSLYRFGGSFGRVIGNLQRINKYKEDYRSRFPRLIWQFVVFGHNEHEISTARRLANDLNMKFYLKLNWDDDYSPIRDKDSVRWEIGLNAASRQEYEQIYGISYMREICHQLWTDPQINWDGKILGCCLNFWGDFGGNAFSESLFSSLNHEKLRYAKEMLLGRKAARNDIPCTTCGMYLSMKARGNWLTVVEIRAHSCLGRLVYHYRDRAMLAGKLIRWARKQVRRHEQT